MSKRTDMFKRIMAAMPEDSEVQTWCAAQIEHAGKSAQKTSERLNMAREVIADHVGEDNATYSKEFASEVNARFPGEQWNVRTASYYLRQLVSEGVAQEVSLAAKGAPKMYMAV